MARRQAVFFCWMQDSNLGNLRHQNASRLNAHSQTDWDIGEQNTLWWVSIQPPSIHWRHNDNDGVKSPASRLLTQPFIQTQIKENIKAPRHWPLCGEFTGTGELPAQKASYAENVSISWRHHATSLPTGFRTWLWRHLGVDCFTPE